MILSKSAEILNFYLNHSSIHPNIAPDGIGYLDGSGILSKDDTYFFIFQSGCLLFFNFEDRIFKGDIYFLPRKRGAKAITAAKQCIDYMFRVVQADKIIVEAPDFNKASQHFIGSLGFNRIEINPGAWKKDGIDYNVVIYEMVNNGKHC